MKTQKKNQKIIENQKKSSKFFFSPSKKTRNFNILLKIMQPSVEKEIEQLFGKFCANAHTTTDTSLALFRQEFSTTFKFLDNPRALLEPLKNFTYQKTRETGSIEFLNVFTQLITDAMVPRRRISECMFFPDKENEGKLVEYLKLATKELELCIFTLTNNLLASTLLHLVEEKHVSVRIISDDANMAHMGSDIETLATRIPIRTDRDLFAHMHNKYVIIDRRILITGSFNWTGQAVTRNNENVIILEDEELALKYLADFERLWKNFENNTVTGKGDLDRLRPKDPSLKKRGRKKKEESEDAKKLKEEKLKKKLEKKEMQEKKKQEKQEKKEQKVKEKANKPKKENNKEKPKKERKKKKDVEEEEIFGVSEKKIEKREKIPRKAKKNKSRHVPYKLFLKKKKIVMERLSKKINVFL